MEFQTKAPDIEEEHVRYWEIEPVVAAKNRVIEQILKHVEENADLSPSTLFKYRLCLDEALTNSITHGSSPGAPITVDFYYSPDAWVVRIVDRGPGFSRMDVPDPTAPGQEFVEHGRGILIMERYCDSITYSGGGRELTLRMKSEELTV